MIPFVKGYVKDGNLTIQEAIATLVKHQITIDDVFSSAREKGIDGFIRQEKAKEGTPRGLRIATTTSMALRVVRANPEEVHVQAHLTKKKRDRECSPPRGGPRRAAALKRKSKWTS